MVTQQNFIYEILILDRSGKSEITTVKSLSKALGYSEKLWEDADIKEGNQEASIEDKVLGISLHIKKVQGSENQETIFSLSVKSTSFEKIEPFRLKLLIHVIFKLGFVSASVVSDNVSEKIASNIYPLIKEAENTVRKKLNKTFTQQNGLNWIESVASKETLAKVNQRKNTTNAFGEFVSIQSTLTDFEDLSNLLQKSPLYNNAKTSWESLAQLRDKVLTSVPLVKEDYNTALKVSKELIALFADDNAVGVAFTGTPAFTDAQVAIKATPTETPVETKKSAIPVPEEKKPAINFIYEDEPVKKEPELVSSVAASEKVVENNVQKVVAAAKEEVQVLEERKPTKSADEFITESVFLAELKKAEKAETGPFVNLKSFVTQVLGNLGYASGPAYTLSRALSETGKVVVYDVKDSIGLIVKAIKSN